MKMIFLLLLISGVLACGSSNKPEKSMSKIESAVSAASAEFMTIEGVVGVGEGKNTDDEACIVVFTSQDSASLARKIPPTYRGFEVILSNIGEVKAQ